MISSRFREPIALILILFLAAILGLFFVFLIPPWQHYDEPNHFEVAWLIANRGRLPESGDYDQEMHRAVALSMIEHDFFKGLDYLPDFNVKDTPIWIGPAAQNSNQPLYYILASIPLHLVKGQDFAVQLLASRLVSMFLFLLSILPAWGIARELTPAGHALRIILPLSIAFLPGYVDVMTSVNNDVAAVCFTGFFLWGSVILLRRGFSAVVLLGTILSAGLCYFSKETAYFTLILVPVILVLSILPRKFHWLAWAGMAVFLLSGVLLLVKWDDAGGWYRSTAQLPPTRAAHPKAVLGSYVFQLDGTADITPNWMPQLFQTIAPDSSWSKPEARFFTLGGWIWADREMKVRSPMLAIGTNSYFQTLTVTDEPQYFLISGEIEPGSNPSLRVHLNPVRRDSSGAIFMDGLFLVEGEYPAQVQPVFLDPSGKTGTLAGQPFQNLLSNASAEMAGPRFTPIVDDFGARILPDQNRPSLWLTSLLDQNGAGWYYNLSFRHLFRTFWARFGWGHVTLLGHKPYRHLGYLCLAGMVASFLWLIRSAWIHRKEIPYWSIAFFLLATLAAVWGMTWVRGISYLGLARFYLPVGRYAYPAVIPTVLLVVLGWERALGWLSKRLGWSQLLPLAVIPAFFIALDIFSIISILSYYQF